MRITTLFNVLYSTLHGIFRTFGTGKALRSFNLFSRYFIFIFADTLTHRGYTSF